MIANKYFLFLIVAIMWMIPYSLHSQLSDVGIVPAKRYLWFNDTSKVVLENAKPVVNIPPLCGKKRRDLGHDLALPFGAAVGLSYERQFYDVSDLMLSSDSTDIFVVGEASVQQSTAGEMRITFRPDVWLLPILNVYGLFGYTRSSTNPNFEVSSVTIKNLPLIDEITLDTIVKIDEELVYYGPTYGGGDTVSAGFKSFFFILDYNYSVTKPLDLSDKLERHDFSGKIGVLLGNNQKKTKGSFWVGFRYINDNHKFVGELDAGDVLPELELLFGEKATYTGTISAKQYWNLVMGVSIMINKHHILVAELGYFKREQASLSYGFQF